MSNIIHVPEHHLNIETIISFGIGPGDILVCITLDPINKVKNHEFGFDLTATAARELGQQLISRADKVDAMLTDLENLSKEDK